MRSGVVVAGVSQAIESDLGFHADELSALQPLQFLVHPADCADVGQSGELPLRFDASYEFKNG